MVDLPMHPNRPNARPKLRFSVIQDLIEGEKIEFLKKEIHVSNSRYIWYIYHYLYLPIFTYVNVFCIFLSTYISLYVLIYIYTHFSIYWNNIFVLQPAHTHTYIYIYTHKTSAITMFDCCTETLRFCPRNNE